MIDTFSTLLIAVMGDHAVTFIRTLFIYSGCFFFALVSLPHRMGVQRQKWQKLVEFVLLTVKSMVLFFSVRE